MKDFLTGVEEKYDKRLLEGRLTIEGNVIACIYSDPLILDEIELTRKDFITSDGSFYFQLAKRLRKNGYSVFDEVTILSSTSEAVQAQFNERGGYTTIKNLVDVISNKNADTYLDNLNKKGIDPIYMEIKNKELIPFKGRATRQNRVKPQTDYQKQAAKFVPKPKKVSPGYKKKRQAQIEDIAARLKKNDGKKKKRYYKAN